MADALKPTPNHTSDGPVSVIVASFFEASSETASFTKEEVTGLLQDLRSSKVKVQGISGTLASIQDTAAWDGKDAPSIDADEPDLEDIMKDEI